MKEKKESKLGMLKILGIATVIIAAVVLAFKIVYKKPVVKTMAPTIKAADMKVMADGMVRSENEAVLRFLTGGKLTYLPIREGDKVYKGQTIASLDTYALQKQLTAALNNYRSVRDSFDQLQDNKSDNYLYAQQANPYPYNYWNYGGIAADVRANAINDMIKRLVDQAQAGLDNSVIQVELANYAMTLSSLQAPFNGIVSKLDVTVPYVIISPTTSFTVVDPESYIFRANVSESDIDYIGEGAKATVQLTGDKNQYQGIVSKVYPDKVTLPTGENVYQVDIQCDKLPGNVKYRQDGTALIANKYDREIIFIPSWLVLGKRAVWVKENGKTILKSITVGDTVGDNIEVHGLSSGDELIVNPESVVAPHYSIL